MFLLLYLKKFGGDEISLKRSLVILFEENLKDFSLPFERIFYLIN